MISIAMHNIWFDNWPKVLRAVVMAFAAYSVLVIFLRLAGKRTLSKMNVFDFVFVVALGSGLAQTILSPDITLVDSTAALAALIALQILLSWLCTKSSTVDSVLNGEPRLLLHKGRILVEAMHHARVTHEEMRAAVRNAGVFDMADLDSVVLETDGTFSVVKHTNNVRESSLADVQGHPTHRQDKCR
jgi:uncharacterized membrane protein YcaP (DUF421 family)